VIEYDGSKNYKAVLLNYDDYTFVKTIIDSVSLDFFQENLASVKDVLSRSLIWNSFSEMVKDAQMVTHKFVEIAIRSLPN
jgi:aminopeptidase N